MVVSLIFEWHSQETPVYIMDIFYVIAIKHLLVF